MILEISVHKHPHIMTNFLFLVIFGLLLIATPVNAIIAKDGACQILNFFSYSKSDRPSPFTNIFTPETLPQVAYSLCKCREIC